MIDKFDVLRGELQAIVKVFNSSLELGDKGFKLNDFSINRTVCILNQRTGEMLTVTNPDTAIDDITKFMADDKGNLSDLQRKYNDKEA